MMSTSSAMDDEVRSMDEPSHADVTCGLQGVGDELRQHLEVACQASDIAQNRAATATWKELVPGVDVWLNTPSRPLKASGTSGLKAANNGVASLRLLDGWRVEGRMEG